MYLKNYYLINPISEDGYLFTIRCENCGKEMNHQGDENELQDLLNIEIMSQIHCPDCDESTIDVSLYNPSKILTESICPN